jgi:tRNA pseudouridine55 synthase
VNWVRRAYGLRRVGHGGTLDPAVSGVLPIALGAATRLLPYLPGLKAYEGTIQLGLRTSSDDLEGEVMERAPVPDLTVAQLETLLEPFRGTHLQFPPQVSAVHVNGERAYALARRGEVVHLEARSVTLHELSLLNWNGELGQISLRVRCSAGTYVRALARDLGEQLGCGGALAQLRRSEALGFTLAQAVPLENLDLDPRPALLDPLLALPHLGRRHLTAAEEVDWNCGRRLSASASHLEDEAVAVLNREGRLAGIARAVAGDQLQPRLVFQAES